MDRSSPPTPDEARVAALGREYDDVVAAILLVAADRRTRVTLGNLRFGDRLLVRLADVAASHHVRLRAIYGAEETGFVDIVVEAST